MMTTKIRLCLGNALSALYRSTSMNKTSLTLEKSVTNPPWKVSLLEHGRLTPVLWKSSAYRLAMAGGLDRVIRCCITALVGRPFNRRCAFRRAQVGSRRWRNGNWQGGLLLALEQTLTPSDNNGLSPRNNPRCNKLDNVNKRGPK